MSLDFLRDSPDVAFRQTISDLRTMNPKFDAGIFECLTIDQIDTLLERLQDRERHIIDESPYGAWFEDQNFMQIKMLQDGLSNLREHIENLQETEFLVNGFTYYNGVRQFGTRVEGQQCTYLGEGRPSNWINFIDCAPIMKALELVRHGDINDFRRIYVEIANGRPEGLDEVMIEHITESTDQALHEMEIYCDARWEGPWPWQMQAPYTMNRIIEENRQMRQQTLTEMHQIMTQMLREFDESGQEQFEITSTGRTMSDTVQSMIEKFAKLAGDAMINLKAMVLTKLGDEAAMKVEHGLTQSVNQTADALARLKVDIDTLVKDLSSHQPTDFGGGMDGMDMGMGGQPDMNAMGGDPNADMGGSPAPDMAAGGAPEPDMGGAPAPDMAAAPPAGGIAPERPRKKA